MDGNESSRRAVRVVIRGATVCVPEDSLHHAQIAPRSTSSVARECFVPSDIWTRTPTSRQALTIPRAAHLRANGDLGFGPYGSERAGRQQVHWPASRRSSPLARPTWGAFASEAP